MSIAKGEMIKREKRIKEKYKITTTTSQLQVLVKIKYIPINISFLLKERRYTSTTLPCLSF
jgi:hypothetical protein